MDLIGYDEAAFNAVVAEFGNCLLEVDIKPSAFIPVSGLSGDNLAGPSPRMPWYKGIRVVQAFDAFKNAKPGTDQALRMPVQDVCKFTNFGDSRRLVVGTVESGTVRKGDDLVSYPSGKRSVVSTLEAFSRPLPESAEAGSPAALTLAEQIYITRGEIAARRGEKAPEVSTRI